MTTYKVTVSASVESVDEDGTATQIAVDSFERSNLDYPNLVAVQAVLLGSVQQLQKMGESKVGKSRRK